MNLKNLKNENIYKITISDRSYFFSGLMEVLGFDVDKTHITLKDIMIFEHKGSMKPDPYKLEIETYNINELLKSTYNISMEHVATKETHPEYYL